MNRAIADARVSPLAPRRRRTPLQVFTLHAELEGMLLLDAFESLLVKWRESGASHHAHGHHSRARHAESRCRPAPCHGRGPGTLGLLAVQAPARQSRRP